MKKEKRDFKKTHFSNAPEFLGTPEHLSPNNSALSFFMLSQLNDDNSRTPLASAPAALPSPGQRRFGPKEEGVFGAWRSPQSSHEKIDKGGLEKEQWLGTLSAKSTEHARKLLEAACPAGSFMDTARPDKCNECPEGHYQPAMRQTVCLACPNGFVNNMNGSTSVGDCCVQQQDVGLYNEQESTSYNYFGVFLSAVCHFIHLFALF